jgi:hypothetical protein
VVASELSNKLAILLFAGIIWWGWWAHTRVEIPTPEQTVKTEESKQMAKAKTPAQMVKITSQPPAATSAQANNTSSIDEKKSPPLEFLGISVNESQKNIEAHLRKRSFSPSKGPGDKNIKNAFLGRFWLLGEMDMFAYVGVESGKIRIIFDKLFDSQGNSKGIIVINLVGRGGTQADIMKYNELIELENKAMQQYFNVLQEKYGKAQMRNNTNGIIKLKDGLIELDSSSSAMTKGFDRSFIILNKYSKVIFYNRQAAQKRLLEIEKANADLVKQGNDI